jgi:AhpD family alkylhydroperoxidase
LVTAGTNDCDYCASAHTLLGKHAGVPAAEAADNLRGRAADPRVQTALAFAKAIVVDRGRISTSQLQEVRTVGYSDAEIVEIIAHVALNTFTNYFNHIAVTEIDFPVVRAAGGGE